MNGFNLTTFMREHGIIRISDSGAGFSCYMRGDILGTGRTAGEAVENALRQKERKFPAVAA